MLFINLIQANLKTTFLGQTIEYYPFTDSTNNDIWELVNEDKQPEGLLVITDDQRRGKGRRDNSWHSGAGKNLTFSFLIKPGLTPEKTGLISLLAGISVCEGIQNFCRLSCTLKWPNDILINGRKIGGILIENHHIENLIHLSVGVGINVNENLKQFPEDLQITATSLSAELGQSVQREPLLAEILNCFEYYYYEKLDTVHHRWLEWCGHLDKDVEFHYGEEKVKGQFTSINPNGHAVIKVNGESRTYAGGILEI